MSAIAGICYWDGRPIPHELLSTMAPRLALAGPDDRGTISPAPGVVMQTYLRHFDQLSKLEKQPYTFANGCVLSFDGRLDNREDLLISLHYGLGADTTDAALASAAYARWGTDAVRRLLGDWSLAIWDHDKRQVLLACDYMGNRPLYYLELTGGIAWASSLEALVEAFDLYGSPCIEHIAGYLTGRESRDLTPYAGIHPVRGSRYLIATERQTRVQQYWQLEPRTIRYKHLHDYADHTRELLIEGVRTRLRSSTTVWAHLSGGWDSSSIVCLANAMVQRGQVEAPAIQPESLVFPDTPESDESSYINAVERWVGLKSVRRPHVAKRPTFESLARSTRPGYWEPDEPDEPYRIVLSGELGDVVMLRGASQAISLLEPLYEGRPGEFMRLVFRRAQYRKRPLHETLIRLAWLGYRPENLRIAYYQRRNRIERAKSLGVSHRDIAATYGVTAQLFDRVPKAERQRSLSMFPRVKRAYATSVDAGMDYSILSNDDFAPAVWLSYPYSHRPLVEFIAGVPQLAFWDPTFARAGMKRTLDGVLPPELLSRNSKGDPRTATDRDVSKLREAFIATGLPPEPPERWHVVNRDFVRADVLTRALANFHGGDNPPDDLLEKIVNTEAWLRSLEARSQAPSRAATFRGADSVIVGSGSLSEAFPR